MREALSCGCRIHLLGVVAEFIPNELLCATTFLHGFDASVSLGYKCAVQTFTLFAETIVVFGSTAIAIIPITTSVVVAIVTVLVTLPSCIGALALYLFGTLVTLVFELAVATFAIFAIFVVVLFSAAIATIPVTRTVVIFVIAVFVTFVLRFFTFAIAFGATITQFCFDLNGGILAFTFFAELVIVLFAGVFVLFAAAVTFVPATFTGVVSVITGSVPNPGELHSLLLFTRVHVGARPPATANTTNVLFANALVFAVVTLLREFATTVITLSSFVVITCCFVGAATERGGGGGGGRGRGSGLCALGGGGGGSRGTGRGEPDAGFFKTVRADRECAAILFGASVSIFLLEGSLCNVPIFPLIFVGVRTFISVSVSVSVSVSANVSVSVSVNVSISASVSVSVS